MGYNTDFRGEFKLNKKLDKDTHDFLNKFADSRRMGLTVEGFGEEGEFYTDTNSLAYDDARIIDYNKPPKTQPGLWCQWVPNQDGTAIVWDENEKFYDYIEWIEYLITKILEPRGYTLTGEVQWRGEEFGDDGTISIKDNKVTV